MKKYLGRLRITKKQLRNVYGKIEFIENEYINIKSPGLKEPGGGYHGNITPLSLKMDKYDKDLQEARKEAERLEKQELDQYIENDRLIKLLEDADEQWVLYQKYIMMKSWNEIIRDMPFEQSAVFKIHREALKNLNSIKLDSSK